ncbi:TetR/AcrR family transcriptional regulator [Nocardia sp. R16R-3T]
MSGARATAGDDAREPDIAEPRTRRRQREESRRLLLVAAGEVFGANGYRGSTTKEIALHAGVSEMTLFRHFPSKAELFDSAVLEPVREFVAAQLVDRVSGANTGTTEEKVLSFVSALLDLVLEPSHPLLTVTAEINQPSGDDEVLEKARDTMTAFLARFEAEMQSRTMRYGFETDPVLVPRMILAAVLSVAEHRSWLLPVTVGRATLASEMAKFIVWGLSGRG